MGNISGNAYALTVLCPIKAGLAPGREIARADAVRETIQDWNLLPNSPMTLVPQTYLCRFFVLDDVYTESLPGGSALDTLADFLPVTPDAMRRRAMPAQDRLQSRYLVFSCNFHGGPSANLDGYLAGMWSNIRAEIESVWQHCYGFEQVHDAAGFVAYMKKCQLETTLFFVGSNDEPLPEQLKALYLKQELAKFAVENQGLDAATLRANYRAFIRRVQPRELAGPTWAPGKYRVE
ncbi:hypothetical protein RQP53_09865 [Paucibacter sp. APW11]|uniref:Uncharacterized protein n=1 Tax=Roseateles aquae TaxID=3077235 RepID=A0ABU3PBF4_9BURK|nr:hypothetical protein [Paucibacter sp. APW11]MDT8999570.1 hypothetical protein [Paucibacter sp. APW11]